MVIEIDQSGRVEYTSHKTIIADSLGNAVYMKKSAKRYIQQVYRKANRPTAYVYEIFALLIAILIKRNYSKANSYIIDTEYPGKSKTISQLILSFTGKLNYSLDTDQIIFGSIKQGSASDATAHREFLKIDKAIEIKLPQALQHLLPQKRTESV